MSIDDNRALVHRLYDEAINRQNAAVAAAFYTEDAKNHGRTRGNAGGIRCALQHVSGLQLPDRGEQMAQKLSRQHYDVVVVGGGASGAAAAIASAKNGARTLLIDASPMLGGDLVSGMSICGCLNARGEWVIGGVPRELFDECDKMGGYVGAFNEWRLNWVVCCDPEVVKLAIPKLLRRYGVFLLLYTFAEDVVMEDGRMSGIIVVNKSSRTLITADFFIDCSGDGDMAMLAGAPFEMGDEEGTLQPVTLIFRMGGLEKERLFEFIGRYPENILIGENPIFPDKKTCVENLIKQGYPRVVLSGKGPLLSKAIQSGEMYPTVLIGLAPTSTQRGELCINTTRIAHVDGTDTEQLSKTLPDLVDQVWAATSFLKNKVPGFERAYFAGAAPRIGVRETRRIIGEHVLTGDDCINGRKSETGIAKGSHHIDIHGEGTKQTRIPMKNGGSYDIPYGCIVPKTLKNVYVAGRCMSSTREANGTARVMGTIMAVGQAAGTAAAVCAAAKLTNVRDIKIDDLRTMLKRQGAVLDGTH